MKVLYLILAIALIVGMVSATEKKLETVGQMDIVQKSEITGETVIRDVITHWEINIASTNANVKADKFSDYFKVSQNAAKAVFHSWATNLVPGTESVNAYIKDIKTGDIKLLKPHARFTTISADGKYVVYEYAGNYETDLPELILFNTETGKETFIAYTSGGNAYGWSTQVFEITNGTVYYDTTYPYPGVNGKARCMYVIPVEKGIKPIEEGKEVKL
jgi:hypothetical protein